MSELVILHVRTSNMIRKKQILSIIITMLVSTILTSYQSIFATASSLYDSGYDHGCDDAGTSDRYINQPGKGSAIHIDEFMSGYDDGFRAFSGSGGQDEFDEPPGIPDERGDDFVHERYYDGPNWMNVCDAAQDYVLEYIGSIPLVCGDLVTSDGRALTYQGTVSLERILCEEADEILLEAQAFLCWCGVCCLLRTIV